MAAVFAVWEIKTKATILTTELLLQPTTTIYFHFTF